MTETFEHPAAIRREYVKHTALRILLWLVIGVPFWVFGTLMYLRGDGYAGLFLAAFFTVVKSGFEIFFYCASRPLLRLSRHRIVHHNNHLEQQTEEGAVIASIDLNQDWSLTFAYNTLGHVLYTLDQADRTLTFSSRLHNAQHLVTEILGRPDLWPPSPPQPESASTRYHRRANPH